jgi:hypothetical protein
MKVSELTFDECRGYLLQRVEPHPITKRENYYCANLSIFMQWRMEVISKLGDIEIREEKPTKQSNFYIRFTNK